MYRSTIFFNKYIQPYKEECSRRIMVYENGNGNGNGNGKTVEVRLSKETFRKAEEIAESKDLSVAQFAKESLQHSIERHEVHDVVADACENEVLSPESRACKHLAKGGTYGEHNK